MFQNIVLTRQNPLWINPGSLNHPARHKSPLKLSCLSYDSNFGQAPQPNLLSLILPQNIVNAITSNNTSTKVTKYGSGDRSKKIKGTVVLMKKNVLDFNDFSASILDRVYELVGQGVSLQLISATNSDPAGKIFTFVACSFIFHKFYMHHYPKKFC